MLNRRLLRIKVFKVLFAKVASGSYTFDSARNELLESCAKTRDLYFFILNGGLALRRYAEEKIEGGLKKYYPTEEEANPNRRFIELKFFKDLIEDPFFSDYCDKKGLNWTDDQVLLIRSMYKSMTQSEYYQQFMTAESVTVEDEVRFLKEMYVSLFEDNDQFEELLEDMSPLWVDDVCYVLMTLVKNMNRYADKGVIVMPDIFSDEKIADKDRSFPDSDEEFAVKLLSTCMVKREEISEAIKAEVSNWDKERLLMSDILLIVMGIVEAETFSYIPVKVSINEYVEISKFYSSKNSKIFVNGILDKLVKKYLEEGKIVKTGKGLIN